MLAPLLTVVERAVLRALVPSGRRSAEALRLTTPYGVLALLQLLRELEWWGYVAAVGARPVAATLTEYALTPTGAAALAAAPPRRRFP